MNSDSVSHLNENLYSKYFTLEMNVGTGKLSCQAVTVPPKSTTNWLGELFFATVCCPCLAPLGLLGILGAKSRYDEVNQKQIQILSHLNNEEQLKAYRDRRQQKHEQKEKNIISQLSILLEQAQIMGFDVSTLNLKQDWRNIFLWDIATTIQDNHEYYAPFLQEIGICLLRLKRLAQEKEQLNSSNSFEAIKKIVYFSLIKKCFKKGESWGRGIYNLNLVAPCGVLYNSLEKCLDSKSLYQQTSASKWLPETLESNSEKSLLETHNELVEKYDYLTPFHHYHSSYRLKLSELISNKP